MMPVISGWEFLDALKANALAVLSATPVVVISAAADFADVRRAHDCRAMKKPIDIAQLMSLAQMQCVLG